MTARRLPNRIASAALAVVLALGFVGLTAAPAHAVPAVVDDEASLHAALADSAVDVIDFDPAFVGDKEIVLSEDIPQITRDLVINGNGWILYGDPTDDGLSNPEYNGFVVEDATVAFNGVSIVETVTALEILGSTSDVTIAEGTLLQGNDNGIALHCAYSGATALTIEDAEFVGNTVTIFTNACELDMTVTGTLFRHNSVVLDGHLRGTFVFDDTELVDNTYGLSGNFQNNSTLTFVNSSITSGMSGIRWINQDRGELVIENSTITGTDLALDYNNLGAGGVDLRIIDSRIVGNLSGMRSFYGSYPADIFIIRSSFEDNFYTMASDITDGPLVLNGNLHIEDSHFLRNGQTGGASLNLHFSARVDILGSTFEDENGESVRLTGASSSAVATIENSTFTGLTGTSAIGVEGEGQFALRHSTVTDNEIDSAVRISGDVVTGITHTVISGNAGGDALAIGGAATANVDWSILGTVDDTSAGAGYVEGAGVTTGVTDPMLAPLADNGGPQSTHLPSSGSPLIDAGNPSIAGAPSFDQRGLARISGAAIDIGSVEVAAPVPPVAPTVSDPVDATVESGETATFSVTATGVPTPSVEWQVSTDGGSNWGALMAGMTPSGDGLTLSVVTTEAFDGYQFQATAENSEGSDVSAAAELTVTPPPLAPTVTGLGDVSLISGGTATFSTTVTGYPAPTMTWEVSTDGGADWRPITEDTAATVAANGLSISIITTDAHDGNQYRVTAQNSEGSDESDPGLLTVTRVPADPTITDPSDTSVVEGATATFSVTAGGYPAPTIEWQVSSDGGANWGPLTVGMTASADGLTLSVVTSDAYDGYQFRAIASNGTVDATSAAALLTVTPTGSTPGGNDPSLVDTGSELPALAGLLGLLALLLGGGLVVANRAKGRRGNAVD